MAIMKQTQMRLIVSGGSTTLDDRGMDILTVHLPNIAIAALGEEEAPLREALNAFADDMEREGEGITFRSATSEKAFTEFISWLREMPIH